MNVSDCCKEDVRIEGNNKLGYCYICTKCNEPCDYLNKEEYMDQFENDYEENFTEEELKELEDFINGIKLI